MGTSRSEESPEARLAIRWMAAVATCLILAQTSCSRRPEHVAPRNVVLITLDTIRADHVGAWGAHNVETPVLDRLAREGARFDHAESAAPLTLPSHATILSGLLPLHHGVRNNGQGRFPDDRDTLATVFARRGYRTGAFIGAYVLDHRWGLARGFETYDDDIPRSPDEDTQLEAERPGGVVVDRALDWLRKADARPFFLWVHLYDAHAPYEPPEPYRSRFADRPYDGEIAYVDAQVGRLVDQLTRMGAWRDTVVVVVGDHGESLGEHGELTHGLLLYEGTLRVPLIVDAPERIAGGLVVSEPVSLADLAPTIESLAGGAPSNPTGLDGHDLTADLLEGKKESPEETVYSETQYPTVFGWSALAAARKGSLKLIQGPKAELYDLARDPRELTNVLDSERRPYRELSEGLARLEKTAVAQRSTPLDDDARRRLESLGYISPSAASTPRGERPDPKDEVGLFVEFERANRAIFEKRYEEAVVALRRLVAADPRNPVFRGSLARALRETGRLEEAIALHRDAVRLDPSDSEAWYNLAVSLREAGHYEEAVVALQESLRRNTTNAEAHNALGVVYSSVGRLDDAEREFRAAIAIDPRGARGFNNLGNILRAKKQWSAAEAAYRKAMEIAPRWADPYNGLGAVDIGRDESAEAVKMFDRALELDPKFFDAMLNRAIALDTMGDRAAAARAYARFIEASKGDASMAQQRAIARRLLDRLGR